MCLLYCLEAIIPPLAGCWVAGCFQANIVTSNLYWKVNRKRLSRERARALLALLIFRCTNNNVRTKQLKQDWRKQRGQSAVVNNNANTSPDRVWVLLAAEVPSAKLLSRPPAASSQQLAHTHTTKPHKKKTKTSTTKSYVRNEKLLILLGLYVRMECWASRAFVQATNHKIERAFFTVLHNFFLFVIKF